MQVDGKLAQRLEQIERLSLVPSLRINFINIINIWSPPSFDILSSCFLTEITSSSHDILLGPSLVCKV